MKNSKEKEHLGDLDLNDRVIINCLLNKTGVNIWS